MGSTLVIGYGNAIRGDDAVGWRAACELEDGELPDGVEVVPAQQLSPEMAPEVSEADRVIFVDASCEGTPGEVSCRKLSPRPMSLGEMPHSLGPADLLGLAQQLYDRSPAGFLITLCGENFEFGDALSPAVEDAFPELLQRVRKLLQDEHQRR